MRQVCSQLALLWPLADRLPSSLLAMPLHWHLFRARLLQISRQSSQVFERILTAARLPDDDKLSEASRDLISKLMAFAPENRLSAAAALQHPWIASLSACQDEQERSTLAMDMSTSVTLPSVKANGNMTITSLSCAPPADGGLVANQSSDVRVRSGQR